MRYCFTREKERACRLDPPHRVKYMYDLFKQLPLSRQKDNNGPLGDGITKLTVIRRKGIRF